MPTIFVWIVIAVAGYWLWGKYDASGGMRGQTYYETCWQIENGEPGQAKTPYDVGRRNACDQVAFRAINDNGLVFAGMEGRAGGNLNNVCPPNVGTVFPLYIRDMEEEGGVSGIDAFLPAIWSVERWATKRWPKCPAERQHLGLPRMVEKENGSFDWEKPCLVCKGQ